MRPTERVEDLFERLDRVGEQRELSRHEDDLLFAQNRREDLEDEVVGQVQNDTQIDVLQASIVVAIENDLTFVAYAKGDVDGVAASGHWLRVDGCQEHFDFVDVGGGKDLLDLEQNRVVHFEGVHLGYDAEDEWPLFCFINLSKVLECL